MVQLSISVLSTSSGETCLISETFEETFNIQYNPDSHSEILGKQVLKQMGKEFKIPSKGITSSWTIWNHQFESDFLKMGITSKEFFLSIMRFTDIQITNNQFKKPRNHFCLVVSQSLLIHRANVNDPGNLFINIFRGWYNRMIVFRTIDQQSMNVQNLIIKESNDYIFLSTLILCLPRHMALTIMSITSIWILMSIGQINVYNVYRAPIDGTINVYRNINTQRLT